MRLGKIGCFGSCGAYSLVRYYKFIITVLRTFLMAKIDAYILPLGVYMDRGLEKFGSIVQHGQVVNVDQFNDF